jgi:hypothetical protein
VLVGKPKKYWEDSMKTRIATASAAALSIGLLTNLPTAADPFFFSTGNPDGKLGALSRRPSPGNIETETADDFVLSDPTVISRAIFHGLIPLRADDITKVEVEIYHIFPKDSNTARTPRVLTRMNSPSDVEIGAATRDSGDTTLVFRATRESKSFTVANTVVNGIFPSPNQFTGGEGAATGQEVEIDITFTPPIFLPADHYFFRPEAQVDGGNFLYLSAPKPILPPGTPFSADLQAWIRNSNLAPDWSRIGTDITHQGPFNMTFTLAGATIPGAGTPGDPNCQRTTVSAVADEFGGIRQAAMSLGFFSGDALQEGIAVFCQKVTSPKQER